ncbi:MAG: GFA family protein [Pseudomonadales bacterium]|nr:GFA family protein [Pseudomonadales bacterium]
MKHLNIEQNGRCSCGETTFTVLGKPIIRALCHCEICQDFNQSPYADITVFYAKDIMLPENNCVTFKTYSAPPAVQRGKCSACGNPAIEFMNMPLFPKLSIIPSANISETVTLPEPAFHSFYHRRISDMDDNLPKYSGYIKSQLAFGKHLVSAMIRR